MFGETERLKNILKLLLRMKVILLKNVNLLQIKYWQEERKKKENKNWIVVRMKIIDSHS